MPDVRRIVCLANSRKLHGRCVAGREWMGGRAGRWIRPVSDREHQEVSEYERQYEDGSDPRVLDVIDIPVLEPRPASFQSENWLLDPEHYWEKVGRMSWFDLPALADPAQPLWFDGHSTYHGMNDRIPFEVADSVTDSLKLVHVDQLALGVQARRGVRQHEATCSGTVHVCRKTVLPVGDRSRVRTAIPRKAGWPSTRWGNAFSRSVSGSRTAAPSTS